MTIHIFIGTEPKLEVAHKVLRHSIVENTDSDVEFYALTSDERDGALRGMTGFSIERWTIPERMGYRDKAIYLDADQLVFGDIRELWETDRRVPHAGGSVWCVPMGVFWNTSVMLIDCAAAESCWPTVEGLSELLKDPRSRRFHYRRIMRGTHLEPRPAALEERWNQLDAYRPGETSLLHFTNRKTQPWFYPEHPLAEVWERALRAAMDDGAVTAAEIDEACDRFQMGRTLAVAGMHPEWRRVV